jgi:hypothetical protein
MATKLKSPGSLKELANRRQTARAEAGAEWRRLAALASEGTELDGVQVERLADVADTLGLADDLESAFNGDVVSMRRAAAIWSEVCAIRAEGIPERQVELAAEEKRLTARLAEVRTERNRLRVRLESVGPHLRELAEVKRSAPRVFPEVD